MILLLVVSIVELMVVMLLMVMGIMELMGCGDGVSCGGELCEFDSGDSEEDEE